MAVLWGDVLSCGEVGGRVRVERLGGRVWTVCMYVDMYVGREGGM